MRIENRGPKPVRSSADSVSVSRQHLDPLAAGVDGVTGGDEDRIELDARQRIIEDALAADAAQRETRIQQLEGEVRSGSYHVDADKVSKAVVDEMVLEGGSGVDQTAV